MKLNRIFAVLAALAIAASVSYAQNEDSKYWFAGAGAGMKISHKQHFKNNFGKKVDFYMFPVFADIRLDLLKNKYSPYLDFRAGYTLGSKAYGVRTYGENTIKHLDYKPDYPNFQNDPYHCLSIKLGIEF